MRQWRSNPQPGPVDFTIAAVGLTINSLQQNSFGQFFAVDLIGSSGNTGAVDARASEPAAAAAAAGLPEPSFERPRTARTGIAWWHVPEAEEVAPRLITLFRRTSQTRAAGFVFLPRRFAIL